MSKKENNKKIIIIKNKIKQMMINQTIMTIFMHYYQIQIQKINNI